MKAPTYFFINPEFEKLRKIDIKNLSYYMKCERTEKTWRCSSEVGSSEWGRREDVGNTDAPVSKNIYVEKWNWII